MAGVDIRTVSIQKKGNEGVWFTLKDPNDEGQIKAKTLKRRDWVDGDGNPVQVKVRCADSDAVRAAQRDVERNKIIDPDFALTSPEVKLLIAKAVLVDMRGLGDGTRDWGSGDDTEASDADKDALLAATTDIVHQILNFSEDRKVFLEAPQE